jgi:hypothetical protein
LERKRRFFEFLSSPVPSFQRWFDAATAKWFRGLPAAPVVTLPSRFVEKTFAIQTDGGSDPRWVWLKQVHEYKKHNRSSL